MTEKEDKAATFHAMSPRQQREHQKKKYWNEINEPHYNRALADRARRRMDRVDSLPEEIRQIVYEHGLEIVWELWSHKFTRAKIMRELINAVHNAENPHSNSIVGLFIMHGAKDQKKARYLIDHILGVDFPNGQRRFKLNKGPNTKPNILSDDDDDEAYYVVGSAVIK